MNIDVKLTSLQVAISSFISGKSTANTGFTFITGRVRLTPGCEFWGRLNGTLIFI